MDAMVVIDELKEFIKQQWGWVFVILSFIFARIIQVSPIKVYPANWIKKGLGWIGKQLNSEVEKSIEKLGVEIEEIRKEVKRQEFETDQKRIMDLRYNILDFADAIRKREFDRETYEHIIFDVHREYDELLNKYGMTNGKVARSMERINERYNELILKNPDF